MKKIFALLATLILVAGCGGLGGAGIKESNTATTASSVATTPVAKTAATSAFAAEVHEYVHYRKGKDLHLELAVMPATPKMVELIALAKDKDVPSSYINDASKFARGLRDEFKFVSCNLKVDVRVDGLREDVNFAGREFDVVDRNLKKIGIIRASAGGKGFVEFTDLTIIDGRTNVVLPFLFDGEKNPPKATVKPKGWEVVNTPFCTNGVCTHPFLHAISRSKEGKQVGDGKVNDGTMVAGLHPKEGTCPKK